MRLMLPARLRTSSTAGGGPSPDGYAVFRDEMAAQQCVEDHWKAERARHPVGRIPDKYVGMSDTSIMAEVSQDLYDEAMAKGMVWVHNDSHGAQHAIQWKKPVAA